MGSFKCLLTTEIPFWQHLSFNWTQCLIAYHHKATQASKWVTLWCRRLLLKRRSSLCCRETKLTAAYSNRAEKTKSKHTAIQISIAFTQDTWRKKKILSYKNGNSFMNIIITNNNLDFSSYFLGYFYKYLHVWLKMVTDI